MLIKFGVNTNNREIIGNIAFHLTFETETIKILIEHGADINLRDEDGMTALFNAVLSEEKSNIEILIDHEPELIKKLLT